MGMMKRIGSIVGIRKSSKYRRGKINEAPKHEAQQLKGGTGQDLNSFPVEKRK